MPTTKRLIATAVLLAGTMLASAPLYAAQATSPAVVTPNLLGQLPVFAPASMLAQSAMPVASSAVSAAKAAGWTDEQDDLDGDDDMPATGVADSAVAALAGDTSELRRTLVSLAMQLRNIPYVRGGRDPSTGFDCSGFVRYVFAHAVGLQLPTNSAGQFLAGLKVDRGDMRPGDLVFFRTAGRKGQGRVSHVGIYIANGQFIHSPSHGKTVRVDSLDTSYWAQRFAGAKRPDGLLKNG